MLSSFLMSSRFFICLIIDVIFFFDFVFIFYVVFISMLSLFFILMLSSFFLSSSFFMSSLFLCRLHTQGVDEICFFTAWTSNLKHLRCQKRGADTEGETYTGWLYASLNLLNEYTKFALDSFYF